MYIFRYDRLPGCSVGEVNWRKSSKRKKRQQRYHTHLHKFCDVQCENAEDISPESDRLAEEGARVRLLFAYY